MINLPGLIHGNDYPDCPGLAGHAIHYHADIGLSGASRSGALGFSQDCPLQIEEFFLDRCPGEQGVAGFSLIGYRQWVPLWIEDQPYPPGPQCRDAGDECGVAGEHLVREWHGDDGQACPDSFVEQPQRQGVRNAGS